MIEKIRDRLLDIIAADARIYRSGNAYGTAFLGVKRIEDGVDAAANYVNLFDCPYEEAADDHRPAIYCGMPGFEASDTLDFEACSGGRTQFRVLTIPLVIVAHSTTKKTARQMRSQLRANLFYILLDHFIEAGHWWKLEIAEGKGSAERALNTISATGGGSTGLVEARTIMPIVARYSINAGGSDA